MASAILFPIPAPMDCLGDIATNWDFFRDSWNDYECATELDKKDMKIRVATFRSVLGRDAQRILQFLPFSDPAKKDSLPDIITTLDLHFKPRRNEVYERYVFYTATQEPGEGIDSFVNRLRRLASSCAFSVPADIRTYEDSMVRDRLILGSLDESARTRVFKDKEIDLEKVIQLFRSSEIT